MKNCNCELCSGKGWIETSVFDSKKIQDGTIVIEKCDLCGIFMNDLDAAKFALSNEIVFSFTVNGFNIKFDFCLN